MQSRPTLRCFRVALLLLGALPLAGGCSRRPAAAPLGPSASPIVAGLAHAELSPRLRGLVLLGELGCAGCHRAEPETKIDPRPGPDLATAGRRLRGDYLQRFLGDPHGTEPGTVMPDLLRDLDDGARAEAVEVLTTYLWSLSAPKPLEAPKAPDPPPIGTKPVDRVAEAAARGRQLFHTIGCVACHAPRDAEGQELELPGSVPLGALGAKYTTDSLRDFLLDPHLVRPAARMPDLRLSPAEALDLSQYLTGGSLDGGDARGGSDKVAIGRALFASMGCANCHDVPGAERAPAKPLAQLTATAEGWRGCLSGEEGKWPFYPLTSQQCADIAAALQSLAEPLGDDERIAWLMAQRNCLACHQRDDGGGIAADRQPFFGSNDASLGEDGRVPPPLTGVGAKLQHGWLTDAIAHGQAERPYLQTRMPGFGEAFANELSTLLARHDELPATGGDAITVAPLPDNGDESKAIINLGRELVGDKGMNCITCHRFGGEQAGAMGAMDLVATTGQRLRPEWFAHYLRQPFVFNPGTLMPQFFPNGTSTRPEFADGDAARQIDAMWHYLAEGRNVRQPSGLRQPPIELAVANEAVLLRRSVQNTGKRGISVGYPGGVNITFDAEHLGLNQIWWGRFVDARPVWSGQGSGQVHILSRELATLPSGPAFVVLAARDAPWPTQSRRELGQRWLGYDLDREQRPTFRYVCAGVEIADTPREVVIEGADEPLLRRTLRFTAAAETTLTMRAGLAPRIEVQGDDAVRIGGLELRLPPGAWRIRPAGDQQELLVTIPIHSGAAELVLDYVRLPEGK